MSKHEIRLRRQKLTGRGADRFRNYGAVMHRVEEEKRMKKVLRVFGYFLIILILVMLLIIVVRLERKSRTGKTSNQTTAVKLPPGDRLMAQSTPTSTLLTSVSYTCQV